MLFGKDLPDFIKKEVYWYFRQVVKRGKKNELSRSASEMAKEYMDKIVEKIDKLYVSNNEKKLITQGLRNLSNDYQVAYYGEREVDFDYGNVIRKLKELKGKK